MKSVTERLRGIGEWANPSARLALSVFEDCRRQQFVPMDNVSARPCARVSADSGEKIDFRAMCFRARRRFFRPRAANNRGAEKHFEADASLDAAKVLRTRDSREWNCRRFGAGTRSRTARCPMSITNGVHELVDPRLPPLSRMVPTEQLHAQILAFSQSEAKQSATPESMSAKLNEPVRPFVERRTAFSIR